MTGPPLLVLASRSPQRRRLLAGLGVPFRVIPSSASERSTQGNPRLLVLELALRKALQVSRRRRPALVLGADTVVCCGGRILLKPRGRKDALRMLAALNGRWHRVYTGVALVDAGSGHSWREATVSRVKARRLDAEVLERMAGRHLDKAGGYALQDGDDPFIERVEGPQDNVIGLPLASVRSLLRKAAKARR